MSEDWKVPVPQEVAATTGGLLRVALIAALAFATMAWLVDEQFRPPTLIVGVVLLGLIGVGLLYVRWQSRYGTATLIVERPFALGKRFAGTIVTELHEAPRSPIRIRIAGWSRRSEVTLARTTVDPTHLPRGSNGSLKIPFDIPPPEEPIQWRPREVRLRARTSHWPVGWGATFVLARDP